MTDDQQHVRTLKWTAAVLVLVIMAVLAVFIVWRGVQQTDQNRFDREQKALADHQVEVAQAQAADLIRQLKDQNLATERNTLIGNENLRAVLGFNAAIERRLSEVLAFFRAEGVSIPARFLKPITPPKLESVSSTSTPSSTKKKAVPPKSRAQKGNGNR